MIFFHCKMLNCGTWVESIQMFTELAKLMLFWVIETQFFTTVLAMRLHQLLGDCTRPRYRLRRFPLSKKFLKAKLYIFQLGYVLPSNNLFSNHSSQKDL